MAENSKVFCLGSNKTGTMSLTQAMRELGYIPITTEKSYGLYLGAGLNHSKNNMIQFFDKLEKYPYDFFADIPFSLIDSHMMIYDLFPDSYYILTIRDSDKWFNSVIRWISKLNAQKMYDWIWGTNVTENNRGTVIEFYEERNQKIIDFFKNNDNFLVLNIEDNSNFLTLSKFLKQKEINKRFPHENKN